MVGSFEKETSLQDEKKNSRALFLLRNTLYLSFILQARSSGRRGSANTKTVPFDSTRGVPKTVNDGASTTLVKTLGTLTQ